MEQGVNEQLFLRPASSTMKTPDEDMESELHDAMYGMVTWTEDELDYRERNVCFCLDELDKEAHVTFSEALKMGMGSSYLGSFLKYLNKNGLNTHDVNVNRLDMITMNIADAKFREFTDRLAEQRASEVSKTSTSSKKDSIKSTRKRSRKSSRKASRKGSRKSTRSKASRASRATMESKKSLRASKKASRQSERASRKPSRESRKTSRSRSRQGSRKKGRKLRGKRPRTSRESRKKTKISFPAEEDLEEEEEQEETGIKWRDEPKLAHVLFPLVRPARAQLNGDVGASQFVICEDLLPLLHQMIKEDVPITRRNVEPRLRRLRLINCDMTEVDAGLLRLRALGALSLAFNWLREVRGRLLPRGLKFLELHGNALFDLRTLCEGMPECLLYLGLSRNRINDNSNLQKLSVSCATQLRSLDLGDNDIAQLLATLEALRGLRHLLALRLHGNPCSICSKHSVAHAAQALQECGFP